ncbi:MAG: hypothetical protein LQ343_001780 [Gyalolechia ehrenbergii]|nr:MAG: hypothetical protein LQ343_001780 [Gyalolechia ehrenbergii]
MEMQPSGFNNFAHGQEGLSPRGLQQRDRGPGVTRSLSAIRRLRSDGMCSPLENWFSLDRRCNLVPLSSLMLERFITNPVTMDTIYSFDYYTESWIEISSQPSSSSLSSAATDDNQLRLQHDYNFRRRRRLNPRLRSPYDLQGRPTSAAGSSQEEYEESESESDRIMTSSNEGLDPQFSDNISPPVPTSSASDPVSSAENDDDDDENSTALGVLTTEPVFTPQPNAFSHPPQGTATTHVQSTKTRTSYFQNQRLPPSRSSTHSYPPHRSRSHTPYNMISPSHQADHDAALRASLSTLLSCAAAARGLPKRDSPALSSGRPSNRIEPSSLRIIPESAVLGEEATRPRLKQRTLSTESITSTQDKTKRKASTSRDRRDKKKTRRGGIEDMSVSPTLLTWVVSAGVVVLFSAISFSAGYVVGKEMGRVEAGLGGGGNGALCGKEVGRKLRLGTPTVA